MKKIITTILIMAMFNFPLAQAAETYAVNGMLIGATVVGIGTGVATYANSFNESDCYESDCDFTSFMGGLAGFGLGAIVGGVLGAGVGVMVPKQPKVQIIPTINPSSANPGAGVNLSVRF